MVDEEGGELLLFAYDPLWIYVLASIKATFFHPEEGDEETAESMYQRMNAVSEGAGPDPEALEWAKANLDLSDA